MLSTNFYVIQTEDGDMIRDFKSMLRINIHQLNNGTFNPNPAELQFYSRYSRGFISFRNS